MADDEPLEFIQAVLECFPLCGDVVLEALGANPIAFLKDDHSHGDLSHRRSLPSPWYLAESLKPNLPAERKRAAGAPIGSAARPWRPQADSQIPIRAGVQALASLARPVHGQPDQADSADDGAPMTR